MKKYASLALVLVLTAAMLVGCGCTNRKMDNTSEPTVLPTNEEIWDTSEATTQGTTDTATMPTILDTMPTETIDRGNGPLEDTAAGGNGTGATDTTEGTVEGRARGVMPNVR